VDNLSNLSDLSGTVPGTDVGRAPALRTAQRSLRTVDRLERLDTAGPEVSVSIVSASARLRLNGWC